MVHNSILGVQEYVLQQTYSYDKNMFYTYDKSVWNMIKHIFFKISIYW